LILHEIEKELKESSAPVFLLGDLNSLQSDLAYKTIAAGMFDLRETCTETYGHYNTFTGFYGNKRDLSRIDHIFGSKEGGWRGGIYAVEENHFDDGLWLSDHRLVIADVTIKKGLETEVRGSS
jgi:endonuclease/exonuclease/phosphatase family metal-dependent hydrolase